MQISSFSLFKHFPIFFNSLLVQISMISSKGIELLKESETVEGLHKTEFKELFSLATKDSHFIFDGTLYKQIDGVAMGSPSRPYIS